MLAWKSLDKYWKCMILGLIEELLKGYVEQAKDAYEAEYECKSLAS